MEQTNFPISRDLSLKRLTADALVEIERLGYSRRSRSIWEHLIEFSGRNELADEFSGDLAMRVLDISMDRYQPSSSRRPTPG
jgi:hypothetical protein